MRRRTTSAAEGRNERKRFHSLGGGEGEGRSFERAPVTQDGPGLVCLSCKILSGRRKRHYLDKSHAFLGSWGKIAAAGCFMGGRGDPSASFQRPPLNHN
jgi:hypothetical protein